MKKILMIDDNKDLTEILSVYLSSEYEVQAFNDPEKALSYYQADPNYFVIVTDYYMPVLLGDKLIEQIFEINPKQQIIIISSGPLTKELSLVLDQYPALIKYVGKPCDLLEINEMVSSIASSVN
ncbi:MAG: hypothetical protein COA79_03600 [Planctomycetota bacterium]|nr:MAG: hypothetical protein COA79_03600 [Planctomycetota bacterium]